MSEEKITRGGIILKTFGFDIEEDRERHANTIDYFRAKNRMPEHQESDSDECFESLESERKASSRNILTPGRSQTE